MFNLFLLLISPLFHIPFTTSTSVSLTWPINSNFLYASHPSSVPLLALLPFLPVSSMLSLIRRTLSLSSFLPIRFCVAHPSFSNLILLSLSLSSMFLYLLPLLHHFSSFLFYFLSSLTHLFHLSLRPLSFLPSPINLFFSLHLSSIFPSKLYFSLSLQLPRVSLSSFLLRL